MVQEASAGKAIEVFQASEFFEIDWSPDGSQLIVAAMFSESEFGNYIVPRLGGYSRSIGFRLFALLSWSPDGTRIAGTGLGQKEIWLMDSDSGETASIQLTGSFEWLEALDWSPSGRFLLFVSSDTEETYTVQIISEDGEVQHQLHEEARRITSARWATSDEAIYYVAVDGPSENLIKIRVNPETGEPVGQPSPLLTGQELGNLDISPATGKLVHAAASYASNLWKADLSSEPGISCSNPMQLTFGTSANERPEFSPDGQSVAFLRGPPGEQEVHVLALNGDKPQQVTFAEGDVWDVAWSRDSDKLAYILDDQDKLGVWMVGATGDNPRLLETPPPSGQLSWSPGQDILYQTPGNRNFNLLTVESGEVQPLIADDSVGWPHGAAFSPKSDHVALFWVRKPDDSESEGLWVINLGDQVAHLVHQTSFFLNVLRWSQDARWIYSLRGDFSLTQGQYRNPELIRIPADGSHPPDLVCALPFEVIPWGGLDINEERQTVVASVARSESDIWLVSNFDPELN